MRRCLWMFVALSGCYPYLSGSYEDYAAPADASLLGELWVSDYAGEFWQDPASTAGMWLAQPDPPADVGAWPWSGPAPGECVQSVDGNPVAFPADLSFLPASQAVVARSGVELILSGDATNAALAGTPVNLTPGEAWDLVSVDGDTAKAMPHFLESPPALAYTSPDMYGADAPTQPWGPVTVAWDAERGGATLIYAAAMHGDFASGESVFCNPGSATEWTFDPDLLAPQSDARGLYLQIWHASWVGGRVPWGAGGNRVSALRFVNGAVFFSDFVGRRGAERSELPVFSSEGF